MTQLTITKPSAEKFSLTAHVSTDIDAKFLPLLDTMESLGGEYQEIQDEYRNQAVTPSLIEKATALKRQYVKIRTETDKLHKAEKSYYLNPGRYIDGWKNEQARVSGIIETELDNIIKHNDRIQAAAEDVIKKTRISLCNQYGGANASMDLGKLPEDVFETYLEGLKAKYESGKNYVSFEEVTPEQEAAKINAELIKARLESEASKKAEQKAVMQLRKRELELIGFVFNEKYRIFERDDNILIQLDLFTSLSDQDFIDLLELNKPEPSEAKQAQTVQDWVSSFALPELENPEAVRDKAEAIMDIMDKFAGFKLWALKKIEK